jgi:hypothetical protein
VTTRLSSAANSAGVIFSPLPRSSLRFGARALAVTVLLAALVAPLGAQDASADCQGLLKRFHRLLDLYNEEGAKAIANGEEPAAALEAARARALKGEAKATIPLVGVTLLIYGRRDMFPVVIIRQVCNLAARNELPLHVVSCAYFNALNPIGDRDEKRQAVMVEIARFDKARKAPAPGAFSPPDEIAGHVDALKACLPKT